MKKFIELERFECKLWDILMSCSRTIGKLFQLSENSEKGIINQALCKFSLNDKVTPSYFINFMNNTIGNLNTKDSSIKNIGAVFYIKEIELLVPSIEVQLEFEENVREINDAINRIENQKSLLM